MQSLTDENAFDVHGNGPIVGTHFHMNGFAQTRFETEAEGNSEMGCFKNSSSRINDVMALGLKGLLGVFRGEGRGSVCMASYGKEIIVVDWW